MKLKAIGFSDVGCVRTNNEDVWISLPECGFFALADGMGGKNAGEVAAQQTIDLLSQEAEQMCKTDLMSLIGKIRVSIEKASRHVYEMGQKNELYHGMGTTLCCLMWTPKGIVYAHVGDSRIYRFRNQKLSLLTQDHSLLAKWLATGKLAEECVTPYPYKHVITRAIGGPGKANPEIAVAIQEEGDLFFLCSDGLTDVLSLEEMESILQQKNDLSLVIQEFIDKAKKKGSSDNMTIVMVQHATNLS